MTEITCLRCHSAMEVGYLLDRGDGNAGKVANWVSDPPEKRWYGIRTKGHENLALVAYRCGACGYVELRAPMQGS
jgi:hypothetical protein